ncbi:unnamed protein product [Agarophyton chilense]
MIWLIIVGIVIYMSYRFLYQEQHMPRETQPQNTVMQKEVPPIEVPATATLSPRDQIAGVVESLDWCNDITRICWHHIGKIVEAQLEWTIQPLINLHLPKPFSNFRFVSADLGKDPLRVDRVIVHRRFKDSIALDLDVHFKGTPNIKMKCAPLSASFGIKELRWFGRLSVFLSPLIKTIPLVGAVHAAMIDHPIIEMDFTGIANISEFSPVERVVKNVLKNVTASMIVLPNRIMYKTSASVDFFDTSTPPLGVMVVTIKEGRGFATVKKMKLVKSIPDIFCRATFGLEEMKTDVVWDKINPVWDTTKAFIISAMEQPFKLKCWDKDLLSTDDHLGTIKFTAKELLQRDSTWEKLQTNVRMKTAKDAEIKLLSSYYSFSHTVAPVSGRCVVSVLVDKAKNLPANSKAVSCCVQVGTLKKETPPVRRPRIPIPGFDPVNPVWDFSCDALCEDISDVLVKLLVLDCGKEIGRIHINADEIAKSESKSKQGFFQLSPTATVRAKIIVRGLVLDALPNIDREV